MPEPESDTAIEKRVETPQTSTVITRTPDGACQSTVTVTVQVTTTLGPTAQPGSRTRAPNDGDTDTGGGSKGGLSGTLSTTRAQDDGDTDTGGGSKGGLGVERPGTAPQAGDDGDTDTGGKTKGGIGAERKADGGNGDNQPSDDTKTGLGVARKSGS